MVVVDIRTNSIIRNINSISDFERKSLHNFVVKYNKQLEKFYYDGESDDLHEELKK